MRPHDDDARRAASCSQLGVESVWAAQPEDISLLHMLFYIHSARQPGAAVRHRGRRAGQPLRGRLAARADRAGRAAGRRRGAHRRARAPDRARRRRRDRARRRRDRARAGARSWPSPPTLAGRIVYDPPLPGYRDQLTQRMPLGTVAKCMAVYDEPFWRAEGLTGQATSDVGPVKLTFDNSPPDGSPGVLLGFLEGQRARDMGRVAPRRAPRGGDRLLPPPVRRARGQARALRRAAVGRGGVHARLLRRRYMPHRRVDELRRGAARADRAAALGRAPRSPRSGRATWTARCAPARPPRRRCWPRCDRRGGDRRRPQRPVAAAYLARAGLSVEVLRAPRHRGRRVRDRGAVARRARVAGRLHVLADAAGDHARPRARAPRPPRGRARAGPVRPVPRRPPRGHLVEPRSARATGSSATGRAPTPTATRRSPSAGRRRPSAPGRC